MKITKYQQSCFLLETQGKKILIDPGSYVDEKTITLFWDIDIILFTHTHNDHCNEEYIKLILQNNTPTMLGNDEVAAKVEGVTVVQEGDVKEFDSIKIHVVKGVHGYNPALGENNPPVNVGFIVDDGKTSVYHCGDTVAFHHDYKADVVLVPACGFGWVMEPEIAVDFCLKMGCSLAIPMHYDSPKQTMLKGRERFESYATLKGLKYKSLDNGESVDV